jgi:hypothetical protein
MSDFMNWSRWFERAILSEQEPSVDVFAVMAWIMAHADNQGTGFGFDPNMDAHIASEIGSTPERVHVAVTALENGGFIEVVDRHDNDIVSMRAVFTP